MSASERVLDAFREGQERLSGGINGDTGLETALTTLTSLLEQEAPASVLMPAMLSVLGVVARVADACTPAQRSAFGLLEYGRLAHVQNVGMAMITKGLIEHMLKVLRESVPS